MKTEHWTMMGLTAALIGAALLYALRYDPAKRGYRWTQRAFFRCSALIVSGLIGGIGLNAVTGSVVALLGLPGYAALSFLVRIP